MEGVVSRRGAVVAAVIISAASALNESDARVDCRDNVAAFERGKGSGL